MTFDILHRDGAARRTRWTRNGAEPIETPVALFVDTDRAPAPAAARLVLAERAPADGRPWVQDLGSRFSHRARDPSAIMTVPADLPYSPAAGEDMLDAAQKENATGLADGDIAVMAAPVAAPDSAGMIVALGAARSSLDNPYTFTKRVTAVRAALGPRRLLYAPGCGRPEEIALLAYVGIDVFDSAPAVLAAAAGELFTPEGAVDAAALTSAGLLPELSRAELRERNAQAIEDELRRVHQAIALGRLRDLVEQRVRARPDLAATLRRLDKEGYDFFETSAPVTRPGPLYATSKESLDRVEVERYRRRIETRYERPESSRVLLVLPCSARKPYSSSRTHRVLARALGGLKNQAAVHEVILTSPLGVVPRELELVYPAAHYDLPVTGHWDEDEKAMIRGAMTALVARNKYDRVIVHLDEAEMEIIAPTLGDFTYTTQGDPLARGSLDALRAAVADAAGAVPPVQWKQRMVDDLAAIASYQFGDVGHALAHGAMARGKWPYLKLVDPETKGQLAMMTPARGLLSPTMEGARRLLEAGAYRVGIEDFRPKGTVFAVGVTSADAHVRVEDDVVLHHDGKLKGVGRALMSGPDMVALDRGAAVNVRHTA